MRDGYAVRAADLAELSRRRSRWLAKIKAGDSLRGPMLPAKGPGQAAAIMTGAPLHRRARMRS